MVRQQVEIAAKYQGYIDRQLDEIERGRHYEEMALPDDLDYRRCAGFPSRRSRSSTSTARRPWARPAAFPASRRRDLAAAGSPQDGDSQGTRA